MTRPLICNHCRTHLKNRLRRRILLLQLQRHSYHATRDLLAEVVTPETSRSWYWDTTPPTSKDLASATTFFRTYLPRKLWTATEWRKQNEPIGGTLVPEVAFLGRSNVGKSSLLNALLISPQLNHVGARPGKTTTMHAWGLAASDPFTGGALKGHKGDTSIKIAVLDMPGYGHASHGDWGNEIIKYLVRRKQLKRVFVMLDALHGVKDSDLRMLKLLRKQAIPHQVVASKCDRLGKGKVAKIALTEALWKMRNAAQPSSRAGGFVGLGEILAVGALGDGKKNDDVKDKTMIGIEDVRYAVLRAAGLENGKSLQNIIPSLETKRSSTFLPLKPSTGVEKVEKGEVAPTQRTSPPAYTPSDFLENTDDKPPVSTKYATQIKPIEDATAVSDGVTFGTFEPLGPVRPATHPPSLPEPLGKPLCHPPRAVIHQKSVEPVAPTHETKVTIAVDEIHRALPKVPLPSVQDPGKPYAASVGYGLRDLYEMTTSEPDKNVGRVVTHVVLKGQSMGIHRRKSKLAKMNYRRQQFRGEKPRERIVS